MLRWTPVVLTPAVPCRVLFVHRGGRTVRCGRRVKQIYEGARGLQAQNRWTTENNYIWTTEATTFGRFNQFKTVVFGVWTVIMILACSPQAPIQHYITKMGVRVLLTEILLPGNRSTGNRLFWIEGKLEKLELRHLSSMRASNCIIPPSEISLRGELRHSTGNPPGNSTRRMLACELLVCKRDVGCPSPAGRGDPDIVAAWGN